MEKSDRSVPEDFNSEHVVRAASRSVLVLFLCLVLILLVGCEQHKMTPPVEKDAASTAPKGIPVPIDARVADTFSHRENRSLSLLALGHSDIDIHQKWRETTAIDQLKHKEIRLMSYSEMMEVFLGGLKRPPDRDKYLSDEENAIIENDHLVARQRLINTNWVIPVRGWLIDYDANKETALVSSPLKQQVNLTSGSLPRTIQGCGALERDRFEVSLVDHLEHRSSYDVTRVTLIADMLSFSNIINRTGLEMMSMGKAKKYRNNMTLLSADYPNSGLMKEISLGADLARTLGDQTEPWEIPERFVYPPNWSFGWPWNVKAKEPYLNWQVGVTLDSGKTRFGGFSSDCRLVVHADESSRGSFFSSPYYVDRTTVSATLSYLILTLVEPPEKSQTQESDKRSEATMPTTRVLWSYRGDVYTDEMLEADLRDYLTLYGYAPEDNSDWGMRELITAAEQYAEEHSIKFEGDLDPTAIVALLSESFELRAWMYQHAGDAGKEFNALQQQGLKALVFRQLSPE